MPAPSHKFSLHRDITGVSFPSRTRNYRYYTPLHHAISHGTSTLVYWRKTALYSTVWRRVSVSVSRRHRWDNPSCRVPAFAHSHFLKLDFRDYLYSIIYTNNYCTLILRASAFNFGIFNNILVYEYVIEFRKGWYLGLRIRHQKSTEIQIQRPYC